MKRILLYTIMCLFGLFSLNAQEAPQNLVATEVTQNSITLTWDAVEGAEDYYVYKDGQLWANTSGATTYTENGLAAGTECCFAVQAVGAAGESEISAEVCATTESVQLAENEIIIGTATTKYYSPFLTILGGGSWFEAIYKSEEIGKACTISELAFSYKDGAETSADINIYLAETAKDEYANPTDVTAESALTLVYSGNGVTLCDEEWETFVLNAPFNYSDENNLVVVVTTENTSKANNWNCYSGDANTVLIKDFGLDSKKPVMKLTLGEGGEGGDDEPAEIIHRLVGIYQNEWNNVAYTYESETSNVVTEVVSGSFKTLLEYNEDGQIVKTTYAWVDPNTGEMDLSNYTLVTYAYEDGVLVSYKEEIINSWYPSSTEFTFTYEEDFVVKEWPNAKETYAFEDGRLVEKSRYYYDQWAETPDFVKENMVKYEYDENGNCVTETQYNTYGEEPTTQNGVDYYYDMTIAAENVATFAYPHEFLPTHANLVTKALSYAYQEDWQTHEVFKSNFEVKTYNYSPEVVAVPVAPVNLVANVLSDTKIELTWETLEAAEYYNVRCNDELIAETTETSYTVENLTAGTEYCFTVTIIKSVAVDEIAESYPSNEACATTYNLVNAVPNEVAFGNVVVGDYWSEKTSKVEIEINRFGKDVNQIKTDNSFFRLPASINYTDDPIKLTVNYKKNSEAGEYTGNLLVMVDSCYTVSIPLSATAYTPVTPDVFELAEEIEFVEGAYTDAPDFATLHDDYNLPNEAEGNNPDAVYSFTLAEEASVEINVESDSYDGIYAVYNAAFEGNGPSTDNNVKGKATGFSYDFEDGSLEDFEVIDTTDGYPQHTWKIENGYLISWDYIYDDNWNTELDWAEESVVTKEAYNITENTVLTFDAQSLDINGQGAYEFISVKVTKDGKEFTEVAYIPLVYLDQWTAQRVDLGTEFADRGLEYGEYRISLYHQNGYCGSVRIDNLELTEAGTAIYPAGDYYIVAAASEDFKVTVEISETPALEEPDDSDYWTPDPSLYANMMTMTVIATIAIDGVDQHNTDLELGAFCNGELRGSGRLQETVGRYECFLMIYGNSGDNITFKLYDHATQTELDLKSSEVVSFVVNGAEGDVMNPYVINFTNNYWNPDASIYPYRLVSKESGYSTTSYIYDNNNRVVEINNDGMIDYLNYNAQGQLESYFSVLDSTIISEVNYVYDANNRLISYTEISQNTWLGNYEFEISYNAEGKVEQVVYSYGAVATYEYNAEGLLIERAVGYDYDGEVSYDSKEVYTYQNGKLVKIEYMNYDWNLADGSLSLAEETTYEYDLNGNCVSEKCYALDDNNVRSLYSTIEYIYNTTVLAEDVYTFEYPHFAFTSNTVKPSSVNVLTRELRYYSYFDETTGEVVNHSHATTYYNYDPEIETPLIIPAAPQNLVATAEGTSITLTWDAVVGAEYYAIYYFEDSTFNYYGSVSNPIGYIHNRVPGVTYCFTVTAINEAGESARSGVACVTVEEPEEPILPEDACYVYFELSDSYGDGWNGNYMEVAYDGKIQKLELTTGSYAEHALAITTGSYVTVTYIVPEGSNTWPEENSFVVRYENGNKILNKLEGSLSETTSFDFYVDCSAPAPTIPAAPQNLVATAEGTSITLTWDAVVGAEYYAIYYFEDSTFNYYGSVSNPIGYIHNRVPGVTYCFTVTAINEAGESGPSNEACAMVEEQVSVIDIEVEVLSATSARVIATPNEATAEYIYGIITKEMYDRIGLDSTLYLLHNDGTPLYGVDDWTWDGLKANTEYYVVAHGQNAYGEWGEVTIAEFTTLSLQIPAAPTNLVAEVKSSSEIQLSWDGVEGAEYYNIYSGDVYLGYIAIPVCIVSNVEYGTHCYTVTAVNEAGESEHSNEACATIEAPHFWTPDPSLYANNMTVIATIAIDGVEQYNTDLELGAFCNGELRGAERLQETAGNYECFLMIYGDSGDNITFKLYDHASGNILDLKSNQSLTFEANATIGDVFDPYVVNFTNTVVHNQALTSGWNWYSTYIVNEGADGLANLENAIGTSGIQIKNQSKFVNQAGGNWYGTLTSTAVEDMYMIQLTSATNVALEGYEVNPVEHPITLGTNWKWISYPLSASISVEEAFASANPSNGDYVKSQTGFAQYYDGLGWSGTLKTMTPGMGYMYQNKSGYAKTLVYPTPNNKSASVSASESESINHWTADYSKYPMNMTMIAVVEGAESAYEVAAFADGECRGSARPIYVEALDSYIMFMTISGEDNETLTFKYYDVETGETYAIADEFTFSVNATVGDVMNPYVMTRGTMGIDDLSSSIDIYPNPVDNELFLATEVRVEEIVIYDIYGRTTTVYGLQTTDFVHSIDVADLEAGVYFVKVVTSEGEIVKRFVKK